MRILAGHTRVVVVIGNKAYKIAKFRPIVVMGKLRKMALDQSEFDRLYQKHKQSKIKGFAKVLFAGLFANWAEWRYWKRTQDARCIPSLSIWLGGLVLVQRSAEPVDEARVLASEFHSLWYSDKEFSKACQFGKDNRGNILIVDYATFT